jgi:hypothetical protein
MVFFGKRKRKINGRYIISRIASGDVNSFVNPGIMSAKVHSKKAGVLGPRSNVGPYAFTYQFIPMIDSGR